MYPATKTLAGLLEYTFTFSAHEKRQVSATSHPEAQLISLLVVATKLLFPFDSDVVKRYPQRLTEPAAQRLNWTQWLLERSRTDDQETWSPWTEPQNKHRESRAISRGKEIGITDKDVFNMSESQLDQYMDWYQRTWVKSEVEVEDSPNKELLGMFPLPNISADAETSEQGDTEHARTEEATLSGIQATLANLKICRAISNDEAETLEADVVRPGQEYRLCRWIIEDSEDGRVSEVEQKFFEEAAKISGMGLKSLLLAVKQTERRLSKWLDGKRRDEYWRKIDMKAEDVRGEAESDVDNRRSVGQEDIQADEREIA